MGDGEYQGRCFWKAPLLVFSGCGPKFHPNNSYNLRSGLLVRAPLFFNQSTKGQQASACCLLLVGNPRDDRACVA